ncbi:MAG: hydantoinase/oxoprolinase family protein, partial [Planctomycetota bacterium]
MDRKDETSWIGLDIGGANIKWADESGTTIIPFELWRRADQLGKELGLLRDRVGQVDRVAVTMTGELADCFESRKQGVRFIVDQVEVAFSEQHPIYYQTNGRFVEAEQAAGDWEETAAANWHAMASWIAKENSDRNLILLDVGSTTTDIIPISQGVVIAKGRTDFDRLRFGELVYCGVVRTPIHSVVQHLQVGNHKIPIAREYFANVQDAFLVLGWVPQNDDSHFTADGRGNRFQDAKRRLAKMVCLDASQCSDDSIRSIAQQIAVALAEKIIDGINEVTEQPFEKVSFVPAGEGHWFARRILNQDIDGISIGQPAPTFRLDELSKLEPA